MHRDTFMLSQLSNVTPPHRSLPAVFQFLCAAFPRYTTPDIPLSARPAIAGISWADTQILLQRSLSSSLPCLYPADNRDGQITALCPAFSETSPMILWIAFRYLSVPHSKRMRRCRIVSSTVCVIFPSFGSLGLSRKLSLPWWNALLHHLCTVWRVVSNRPAIKLLLYPFLCNAAKDFRSSGVVLSINFAPETLNQKWGDKCNV